MKLVQILPRRRTLSYQVSVFNPSLLIKKKRKEKLPIEGLVMKYIHSLIVILNLQ